jgi:hypothetical protein
VEAGITGDVVQPVRRGVPSCPRCGESQRIEPLQRVRDYWYLRCLACHFGVRMALSKVKAPVGERRSGSERRRTLRGGMRHTDMPVAGCCERCAAPVAGWLSTPEALWARCEQCGRITRVEHHVAA